MKHLLRRSGISRIVKGITRFYLHTLHFIHKWNELYLPLPSQPQQVLIYRPRRDGRLSRPWCKVSPAEIRTCNLPDCKSGTLPHGHQRTWLIQEGSKFGREPSLQSWLNWLGVVLCWWVQEAAGRSDKRTGEEARSPQRNTQQTSVPDAAAAGQSCRQSVVMGRQHFPVDSLISDTLINLASICTSLVC